MTHPKHKEYMKKWRLKNRKEGPGGDGIETPDKEVLDYIEETLQFDSVTGHVSYKNPCTRKGPGRPRAAVGVPLGYLSNTGYLNFTVQCSTRGLKRQTRVHHIGWFLYYGVWPTTGWHLHHQNGDRCDNRIDNLELILPEEHGRIHAEEYWSSLT